MGWLNNLKSRLIKKGWGDAIELLNTFKKHSPIEFEEWKKTGSHILLRDTCNKFRNWSIYKNTGKRPMPFENDVEAISSCWRPHEKENNEKPY